MIDDWNLYEHHIHDTYDGKLVTLKGYISPVIVYPELYRAEDVVILYDKLIEDIDRFSGIGSPVNAIFKKIINKRFGWC